jgi:hypothetical protein
LSARNIDDCKAVRVLAFVSQDMVESAANSLNEPCGARWCIRPVDCVQSNRRALHLGHIELDERLDLARAACSTECRLWLLRHPRNVGLIFVSVIVTADATCAAGAPSCWGAALGQPRGIVREFILSVFGTARKAVSSATEDDASVSTSTGGSRRDDRIKTLLAAVHESGAGTFRTSQPWCVMSAVEVRADEGEGRFDFSF